MEIGGEKHPLTGWIPWKVMDSGLLAWLPLDDEPFRKPFFQDSLSRLAARNPRCWMTHSSMAILDQDLEGLDSLDPALFIFNISRCGSTLLAQMLGTDSANVVLSEPPLLDLLLQTDQDQRVKPLLRLLGQKRFPESRRLILKLDSWHFAFHGRLRELFPTTPFVLLYREPAWVMASQRKVRGMPSLPGALPPSLFGFDPDQLPQPSLGVDGRDYLDAYLVMVLTCYFQWIEAIATGDRNCMLVDFEEGPEASYRRILTFAGLDPGEAGFRSALDRARFHGKRPGEFYQQDPPPQQAPAHLREAYLRVDAMRRALTTGERHVQ